MPPAGRYKEYIPDSFYHLYNRGVDKRTIFKDDQDYSTFLRMCRYTLTKKGPSPIELSLMVFCSMPNHYHFLVRQGEARGITRFIRSVASNYVPYFNEKYERIGPLFQGRFQAKRIETDEGLLHLSRYLHINPVVAGLVNYPGDWRWSSYREYLGKPEFDLCCTSPILQLAGGAEKYQEFVAAEVDSPADQLLLENLALE